MLGIVGELDDIAAAVIGFKQMSLGAAAHFADHSDSVQRHSVCSARITESTTLEVYHKTQERIT